MKKIFLHWSPPAFLALPSPALSLLKSFLETNGYKCQVIYWNRIFYNIQQQFLLKNTSLIHDKDPLLLYLNYIAFENDDAELLNAVKVGLIANAPSHLSSSPEFYYNHMLLYKQKVDELLDEYIKSLHLSDALYFGFSLKFEQWVFAYMLSLKLKKIFPHIPIIVGGIISKKAAESFLYNFHQFDIAMWGEGEFSLLELTQQIKDGDSHFSDIPRIAYRDKEQIICSLKRGRYADLSADDLIPDFSDFFENISLYPIYDYALSIEFSRGCHWNRCHFCYLNEGYRYRRKSIQKIKDEILKLIDKYKCFRFSTTDNDLIGADFEYFNQLLDVFIEIKKTHPQFAFVVAEVITKGLNREIIKKMADAGFINIQIGYENSSNQLLSKIEKSNTFASNLLFIKFACQYKIHITGLNVIYNLFEETDENIIEATHNLKFLRFYRAYLGLKHRLTPLAINTCSRYYKTRNDIILSEWQPINSTNFHLKKYWHEGTGWHVLDYAKTSRNFLWTYFEDVDKYYFDHKYRYKIRNSDSEFEYNEICDNKQVAQILLKKDSPQYLILQFISVPLKWDELNN